MYCRHLLTSFWYLLWSSLLFNWAFKLLCRVFNYSLLFWYRFTFLIFSLLFCSFFFLQLHWEPCTSFGNGSADRARFNEARSSFGRHAFLGFVPVYQPTDVGHSAIKTFNCNLISWRSGGALLTNAAFAKCQRWPQSRNESEVQVFRRATHSRKSHRASGIGHWQNHPREKSI